MAKLKLTKTLLGFALGMLALAGTPALGQTSGTKNVNLNIQSYIDVQFTSSGPLTIDINFTAGSNSGVGSTHTSSNTASFLLKSNTTYSLAASIGGSYTGPGTLAVYNYSFSGTGVATSGATGSLQIRLTGVTSYPDAGTYTGATVVLTITG